MTRAGASLLVGGNTNLVRVSVCLCVLTCTHARERSEKETGEWQRKRND